MTTLTPCEMLELAAELLGEARAHRLGHDPGGPEGGCVATALDLEARGAMKLRDALVAALAPYVVRGQIMDELMASWECSIEADPMDLEEWRALRDNIDNAWGLSDS